MSLTNKIWGIKEVEEVEKLLNTKLLKKFLLAKQKITQGINERVFQEKVLIEVQVLDNQMLSMFKHILVEERELLEVQWLDQAIEKAHNIMVVEHRHLLAVNNIQVVLNSLEDNSSLEVSN